MKFLHTALLVCFIAIMGCKSGKVSKTHPSGSNHSSTDIKLCDQTIRYYAEKLSSPDGQEVSTHTEIVINPSTKRINLKSAPPDQDKVDFDTVIESFDCNINADWTEGHYHYFIQRPGWKDRYCHACE